MDATYNHDLFIDRDAIESANGIEMPIFYDSEVERLLMKIKNFLSDLPTQVPQHAHSNDTSSSGGFFGNFGQGINVANMMFSHNTIDLSNTTKTTVVQNGSQPKKTQLEKDEEKVQEKEKKENAQATLIAAASGLFFLATAYLTGKASANSENIDDIQADINMLKFFYKSSDEQRNRHQKLVSNPNSYNAQLKTFGEITESKVISSMKKAADLSFKVKAFLAGSALFTTITAFFKYKQLMQLGGFSLLAGAGFWLYQNGRGTSAKLVREKHELKEKIETILRVLNTIPKSSKLEPVSYDSLRDNQDFAYWSQQQNPQYQNYSSNFSEQHQPPFSRKYYL